MMAGMLRELSRAESGPTQIVSSAILIGSECASAFEWASTERMPSSRHVRMIRSAISPRFAIRILWNTARTLSALSSAAQDLTPLRFELGEAEAVDARHRFGDRLAGAEPRQELAQRLDPAPINEVAHDPERDVVTGAGAQRIGLGGQRFDTREPEASRDLQHRIRGRALEDLRQSFVKPARGPAAGGIVDDGVGVFVHDQALELAARRTDPADRETNLPVEQARGPRVGARHVLELVPLVQHDRRPLVRRVGEHPPDPLRRRLEQADDRATGLGIERVAVLHDEAPRDVALEAGLGPLLALDLPEKSARRFVRGLALEHRAQMHDRSRGLVAAIVEVGDRKSVV